jgi:TM2 domain-containing membrane protein YozV
MGHNTQNLSQRRMDRLTDPNHTGIYAVVSGWVVDHSIYLLEVLWGFIWPILAYILWIIFTLVLMVLLYILMFYVLYLFITS